MVGVLIFTFVVIVVSIIFSLSCEKDYKPQDNDINLKGIVNVLIPLSNIKKIK
jgi:hypothetical protein